VRAACQAASTSKWRASRVGDVHGDRDAWPFLDELGWLEAASLVVVLGEEVDHLLAIASGRRLAFPATAGNAEPLRVRKKQVAEPADVAAAEGGECSRESLGAVAHR